METLHAPWRIQYILGPKETPGDTSLFARIAQSNEDETNLVVFRGRSSFILLNRFPYNGGHLMVVPYKQTPNMEGLMDEELAELFRLVRTCQRVLDRVMRPDGYNIGINLGKVAGAGVADHLHIHVVPRWNGDTNFMPVLASTTVLPEALRGLCLRLREAFAEQAMEG